VFGGTPNTAGQRPALPIPIESFRLRACPEIGFVAASLLAVAPEVIGFPKAASRLAATINR
jgi:hypothetical protein